MTTDGASFYRLVEIMKRLRGLGGCPWDAEQTHDSLKRYLIEECYEALEAIETGDDAFLKEELGDVLLQPVFHAAIAEEEGRFTIDDIIDGICSKLVRRHPHVFGEVIIRTSAEQIDNWEKIKQAEKQETPSILAGIPPNLPALLQAQKLTEKAARVGFDWEKPEQIIEKVQEELQELLQAITTGDHKCVSSELGDLLFSVVNLARVLDVDPEDSLRGTINKFKRRFAHIEHSIRMRGRNLSEATFQQMEYLWNDAKKMEQKK